MKITYERVYRLELNEDELIALADSVRGEPGPVVLTEVDSEIMRIAEKIMNEYRSS